MLGTALFSNVRPEPGQARLIYYAECHFAACHYAECHYAECRYAECSYAECCGAVSLALLQILD